MSAKGLPLVGVVHARGHDQAHAKNKGRFLYKPTFRPLWRREVLCEHFRVMHACCTMTMLQNWHTPCHHNVHVFTDCAEAVVILSGVGPRDSCANLPCTFNTLIVAINSSNARVPHVPSPCFPLQANQS